MSQFSNVLIISACNDIVCQYKKKNKNKESLSQVLKAKPQF